VAVAVDVREIHAHGEKTRFAESEPVDWAEASAALIDPSFVR
jgi:hypothetical protein